MPTYTGFLELRDRDDAMDLLSLSSHDEPLADVLGWMSGKHVTIRYWITDMPCTRDEADDAAMRTVMGAADVELCSVYSEITGYLWTDENLKVGGHDMLRELHASLGKWLILDVQEHSNGARDRQ